jgi:bacterioferritin (cytochrome b1)
MIKQGFSSSVDLLPFTASMAMIKALIIMKGATPVMQFKNDQDRQEVLNCLLENMNEEFRATLQYICHRISAKGRHEVLSDSFKSAALDEMSHILFFSDMLTKCGETPRFTPWPLDQSDDIRSMLTQDIVLEKKAQERYTNQLERFSGYPELATLLQSVLGDEGDHEELFTGYLEKL